MSFEGVKYTRDHEWIRFTGDVAVIGITEYAQRELGDITYVELPEIGKEVKHLDSLAVIESVKAASDVYSPVSGMVKEVNHLLENSPEKINSSPYGEGWICKVLMIDRPDESGLLDRAGYEAYLEEQKAQ